MENTEASVKIENLNAIINDSAKLNSPKITKRGRGRPRKDGNPNKSDLNFLGLDSDPLEPPPEGERISIDPEDPEPGGAAGAPPPEPEFEIPAVVIKFILEAPFTIARTRTGYQGFGLPEEAADACVPLARKCLDQYMPDMGNSKHFPLIMLCMTLGGVAYSQMQGYEEWKFKNAKPVDSEPPLKGTPQTEPFETNGAGFMNSGAA